MTPEYNLGRIFTPLSWAEWLLEQTGAFDTWWHGGTICDPTFGDGSLLRAFFSLSEKKRLSPPPEAVSRLFGVEIEPADKFRVQRMLREKHGVEIPLENLITADVLAQEVSAKYDILVGNPPWMNFSKLSPELRERWSQRYIDLGLVQSKKDVLLGSSRADLATAVLKKVLDTNLAPDGHAMFFIPLSIFYNSGANDRFRPFPGSDHSFSVSRLWDLGDEPIFEGVATRYGAVQFKKGSPQQFPVPTRVRNLGRWVETFSSPSDGQSGFWQRHDQSASPPPMQGIAVEKERRPRQGVNTCGANRVLIFNVSEEGLQDYYGAAVELEPDLLFPLMDVSLFPDASRRRTPKSRMVLLPYERRTGRPLTEIELQNYPRTWKYLQNHRESLENRKGTMIQGSIKRGYWWSLLGVGPYSFAPWKVAWEALGRSEFRPVVLNGRWQGNQAMHAFCPCRSKDEAEALLAKLSSQEVEDALKASAMGGTLNWAQPGRVSKILELT